MVGFGVVWDDLGWYGVVVLRVEEEDGDGEEENGDPVVLEYIRG